VDTGVEVLRYTVSLPVLLASPTVGEAKAQGRECRQGWGRARGLHTYVTPMPRDALLSTVLSVDWDTALTLLHLFRIQEIMQCYSVMWDQVLTAVSLSDVCPKDFTSECWSENM